MRHRQLVGSYGWRRIRLQASLFQRTGTCLATPFTGSTPFLSC